MYGQTGSGKTHTLFGPPSFFKLDSGSHGICPKFFAQMLKLAEQDSSLSFTASAVELYFNDCNDLLNGKAKIPIAGQQNVKGSSMKQTTEMGGLKAEFDAKGKWVPPALLVQNAQQAKQSYQATGQKEIPLNTYQDVKKVMELIEVTRSSKGH